jgi:hypothetical protein
MIRLWVAIAVAAVAFVVYSVIDVATMPRVRIRSLRRGWWILIVLLLPVLGAVLWFLLGRAPASGAGVDGRYRGPDDDPDFLGSVPQRPRRSRSDKDQDDETLRDLEQQFRDDGDADR